MFKLAVLLLFVASSSQAADFTCPTGPITAGTPVGNLPTGASNLTIIPQGTNCTFTFNIPSNYALQLKFSVDFQSDNDKVYLIDSRNLGRNLRHTNSILYDAPIWVTPKIAKVQVIGVSGNSRFFFSYMYKTVADYQAVTKKTGEYFALSDIAANQYYVIKTPMNNEMVVATVGQRPGAAKDYRLQDYYVYDGDNINTANFIGTLDVIGTDNTISSSGQSFTIVNFYGTKSQSYVIGNDASTVKRFNKYTVLMMSRGLSINGNMTDLSNSGGCYTFICPGCSTYYWTQLNFDSLHTVTNLGYISFQGQTPTHKMEKLIKYDAQTFTSNQLPQMLPTDIFTVNLYTSRIAFYVNTVNDATLWKKPYDGRKGLIFAPSLWTNTVKNNFNHEFRDDSQLYKFTLTMDKMIFPASSDQMTLKIGSGNGNATINNIYPRDKSSTGKVISTGNYMQVALTSTAAADVRLSFEMNIDSSSTAIGVFISMIFTMFYMY